MLIEISMIHIGGYAIIKTGRRKNGDVGSLLGAVSSTSPVVAARPTPSHLKLLSATVVALIRFISHLNIKICKLLSLKLHINQIRVVFSHLKLWVKVVRHNSKGVKI